MPIDGVFLSHLTRELAAELIGARLDKITQPEAAELRLQFRTAAGQRRTLLLSARPGAARIHFTETRRDNPEVPPMFCMLARKLLAGARVVSLTQPGAERMADLALSCYDEMGDPCVRHIVFEMAGRIPNVLLLEDGRRITDCLRRVPIEDRAGNRPMQPGLLYRPPEPPEGRRDVLSVSAEELAALAGTSAKTPSEFLLSSFYGLSPLAARELAGADDDRAVSALDEAALGALARRVVRTVAAPPVPTAAVDASGKLLGFSFLPLTQFGPACGRTFETCSALLDFCFAADDRDASFAARQTELAKPVRTAAARLERKLTVQREELAATRDRERFREKGDILNAFLDRIPRGAAAVTLPDLYDPDGRETEIALDPRLSPQRNAQKYYAEYRRLKSAQSHLETLIADGERELDYLRGVLYQISAADAETLSALRAELAEDGLLARRGPRPGTPRRARALPPKEFRISNGMTVLCGRTARQNEELTFRTAAKTDWWFHVKNAPGSHCILLCGGAEPSDRAFEEAAAIAAANSSVAGAGHTAVDYTMVRNLKKMPGGKPGSVIYEKYWTLYTD